MKAEQGMDAVLRYRCSKEHKRRVEEHVDATPGDNISDFIRRAVESYLRDELDAEARVEKMMKDRLVRKAIGGRAS